VEGVTFSPDGHLIASVGFDGALILWDASNGQLLEAHNIGSSPSVMDHVAFSPDGSALAINGIDPNATLEFANPFTGQSVHGLFLGFGNGLAVSPDGLTLAVARSAGIVSSLVDANTMRDKCDLEGASDIGLGNVAFSPSGLQVAGAGGDGFLYFWDVSSCKISNFIGKGQDQNIKDVAFSPDGRLLASGSRLGTVEIWDLATAQLLFALEASSEDISFSPDGLLLASTSGVNVKVWDVSTGQLIAEFEGHTERVESVAFSPDGRLLVSGSKDGTAKLWEIPDVTLGVVVEPTPVPTLASGAISPETVAQLAPIAVIPGNTKPVFEVEFSPDGNSFATVGWDGVINLWDAQTGQLIHTIEDGGIFDIDFSPDGNILASVYYENILLWSVSSGELIRKIEGDGFISNLDFNSDGTMLVTGGSARDWRVIFWDTRTWQEIRSLEGLFEWDIAATDVAFSPTENVVAAWSGDKQSPLKIVDADTGAVLDTPAGDIVASEISGYLAIRALEFSPDGRTLAIGSGPLKLWGVHDKKLITTLQASNTRSVAFHPSGKLVAAGNESGLIYLFDTQSSQLLTTLDLNDSNLSILTIAFSPDGSLMATGDSDGNIRLWGLPGR
jgi:WD40 repeat protein